MTFSDPQELAYDEKIAELTGELDAARQTVTALEAKLAWWQRGRELYGGTHTQPAAIDTHPASSSSSATVTTLGAKPTLAHAIITVMELGTPDHLEWSAPELIAQLRERGWMPGGQYGQHTVRTKLGQLAKPDGPLRRVRHGVYMLATVATASLLGGPD